MTRARWLVNATLVLALAVIALGAYTRLTDAGLGCQALGSGAHRVILLIHREQLHDDVRAKADHGQHDHEAHQRHAALLAARLQFVRLQLAIHMPIPPT